MTAMDIEDELDFLEYKVALVRDCLEEWQLKGFDHMFDVAAHFRGEARPRKRAVRSIEDELHLFLSGFDWEPINAKLRERFGFIRLGYDEDTVIRRVLKRGRIRNMRELEVIRAIVANQGNIQRLGVEQYDKLAEILDEFESQAHGG